jgi:NAD(P)-dependent dehydrogenase (short-subunit alcohol dehydrogenase family)
MFGRPPLSTKDDTMSGFTARNVPDQHGRTTLVTGANTGLGFWTAVHLAKAGARVLIGSRSADRGAEALDRLRAEAPGSDADVLGLDLSSLAAVEDAAGRLRESEDRLDLLINNAGVMMPPYGTTADGFELQLGVNHLGHFALTAHLLPMLAAAPSARVVSVSSLSHRNAEVYFDDLQAEQHYSADARYGQSKLANLLFTFELDRRLRGAGSPIRAVAAHPGIARTELSRHFSGPVRLLMPVVGLVLNSAEQGSWPSLMAATSPDVDGGDYVGPTHFGEMAGPAGPAKSTATANNENLQRRFWDVSVELTGIDPQAALG